MHGKDELYHNMRGPAKNLTILSSAYSDPKQRGTGEHEPITYEVKYGKGRVIITTMGHFWNGQTDWDGLHCVGFQTIFARSVEYAATGKVTLPIPKEFPGADQVSFLEPHLVSWNSSKKPYVPESKGQCKKEQNPYAILTPEEELETFELAPGYVAELVAAEPQIQEPVLTVWDGNGAMYVAEMRSYMQDENGTEPKPSAMEESKDWSIWTETEEWTNPPSSSTTSTFPELFFPSMTGLRFGRQIPWMWLLIVTRTGMA